ncbi:hypothetical protein [Streptacidiphilus carbonis]|uniref:hypothetical protein n=1 Tax=Streptacidiphilus carbonis TaxID=105422 RepID=UPI0005A70AB7|nr:hypothetical protein [Streptacidiphilus carbonis]
MRPDRFQTLLANHLPALPGITKTETFADAGHDRSPYGLVIHHDNGARTWWQITATSRPGDVYSQPEGEPVTGERQAELPMPNLAGERVDTAAVEGAIAAVLLQADAAGEVAAMLRYSQRENPGAISHGLTVHFHDGSKIFVNGLAASRGSEPRPSSYFKLDAHV